jgi:lysine 2,3-aminomutase
VTRLIDSSVSRTLRTGEDLAAAGLARDARELQAVMAAYATAITPALAGLIDRNDPNDPIARQFVPSPAELDVQPEELPDPIGDMTHEPVPGIVHRYPDRVLLKAVAVCPVYCRFCFRREMVGPEKQGNLSQAELDGALAYIRAHPEIWEVIITGGDPFMLSTRRAEALTRELDAIPHVKVIRWHTRMPVADPERISNEFVSAIGSTRKAVYVAVHCNHSRELTDAARAALSRMADAGVVLLSQTVLLKGVNDTVDTLVDLMRSLMRILRPARHISAPPSRKARRSCVRCATASRASPSRTMSSTFPAASRKRWRRLPMSRPRMAVSACVAGTVSGATTEPAIRSQRTSS